MNGNVSDGNGVADMFGAFAWWNFSNCWATPDELRSIVAAAGRTDIIIDDINGLSELRRMIRVWRRGRGSNQRFRTELAFEDDDFIVVGLLTHTRVKEKEVMWKQVENIVFEKQTEKFWDADLQNASPAMQGFVADARRVMSTYDNRYVRPLVSRIFNEMGSVKLQRNGSLHFVPFVKDAGTQQMLETLESIVGNIGDCSLSVVPQNSASAKKQAERGIREKLFDELGELTMRMKALFDDDRKRAPSGVAVDHLLESFVDLRCQAQMYCDSLQIELDSVVDQIDQLQTATAKLHTNDKPSEKAATMKVRESIVEKFQTMLTQNDYRDGQIVVFDEHQMENAGICKTGRTMAKYYREATAHTRAGNGYRALASLGLSGVFDEANKTLEIAPMA